MSRYNALAIGLLLAAGLLVYAVIADRKPGPWGWQPWSCTWGGVSKDNQARFWQQDDDHCLDLEPV